MNEPSTDWKENVAPDEDERFGRYAELIRGWQRKHGSQYRGLHAKGFGARGKLTVRDDLPAWARVGLVASPTTYDAIVRFSNGGGAPAHDRKGDVRGIAIKVLNVPGKKIIPGMEDARTQDLLLIRTPSTPLRTPDEFLGLLRAMNGNPLLALPRLFGTFGGRTFGVLGQLQKGLKEPMPSFATTKCWSVNPIRFGKYAARWVLTPQVTDAQPAGKSADYLKEEMADRLAEGPVVYELGAQFFADEKRTPIEDSSVAWDSEVLPLATLTVLKLDSVEDLSFDPWHALVEHRPLGAMMRARNHAYRLSTQERKAAPEPA